MREVTMVMGMQFGSEAKGSISAAVAKYWKPDTVATAWGPNAGHTVRDGDFKFVSTMLASGALYPSTRDILIGPGSVVDFNKLAYEIKLAGGRLAGKTLHIHPNAAVLKPEHAQLEADLLRIGSTMKGTMQSAVGKMHRNEGAIARGAANLYLDLLREAAAGAGLSVDISKAAYDEVIDSSQKLLVEGAQGFSLGIHEQFYPYCTSRDVSTAQTLADCRVPIPNRSTLNVVGVLRTYPIRVANRASDLNGAEIEYSSGGFYEDQHELDWQRDLGREPELTTVTRLPRRVFNFSFEQIREAVRVIRPTSLALTFCDYLESKPDSKPGLPVRNLINALEMIPNTTVGSLSYGPDLADIYGLGGIDDEDYHLIHANYIFGEEG